MFALSSDWEKNFLVPSMARSTAKAFNIVRCLDHTCELGDAPRDKRRKVATASLRDKPLAHDFAGPFSLRASRILGPISRFRVAEILPLAGVRHRSFLVNCSQCLLTFSSRCAISHTVHTSSSDSKMETRTHPIGPEDLTRYPAARSPSTGVLMGVHWYGWALEASTSETWFLHRGFFNQARFHALTDRVPVHQCRTDRGRCRVAFAGVRHRCHIVATTRSS